MLNSTFEKIGEVSASHWLNKVKLCLVNFEWSLFIRKFPGIFFLFWSTMVPNISGASRPISRMAAEEGFASVSEAKIAQRERNATPKTTQKNTN